MNWKSISNSNYTKLLGDLKISEETNPFSYSILVEDKHLNSGNAAHGGFIMSVLDNVMGNAAHRSFENKAVVTISMTTHFVTGAKSGDLLICQPFIEKRTNTLSFVHAELRSKNEIIATGSGIWKLIQKAEIKPISQKLKEDDGGW